MVRVFFTFHWPFRTEPLCRINFDTEAFWKQREGAMGWSSHRWVCTAKWLRSKNEQKYIITVIYQTAIRKETPLQMISLLLSKSPESATTVVYFLSCSRAEAISAALFLAKSRGWAGQRSFRSKILPRIQVCTFSIPYIKYLPLNFISGFSKNRRNQDGGRRRVDCCSSHRWFEGLFSESCFFIIGRCELELFNYCESYT